MSAMPKEYDCRRTKPNQKSQWEESIVRFSRCALLNLGVGAAALPAVSHVARAQAYPSRTARIVVGFPSVGRPTPGAPDGRVVDGTPWPAIHRREQARRERQHRNQHGRQGACEWLHAVAA